MGTRYHAELGAGLPTITGRWWDGMDRREARSRVRERASGPYSSPKAPTGGRGTPPTWLRLPARKRGSMAKATPTLPRL